MYRSTTFTWNFCNLEPPQVRQFSCWQLNCDLKTALYETRCWQRAVSLFKKGNCFSCQHTMFLSRQSHLVVWSVEAVKACETQHLYQSVNRPIWLTSVVLDSNRSGLGWVLLRVGEMLRKAPDLCIVLAELEKILWKKDFQNNNVSDYVITFSSFP